MKNVLLDKGIILPSGEISIFINYPNDEGDLLN